MNLDRNPKISSNAELCE
jgi:hypothetical protein